MKKIRVLVVDDSTVIRRVLSDILAEDADLEVVGTASDGRSALRKLQQLQPDIVTLDVEMPEMSGLDVLVEIRKIAPKLPVIMFSAVTQRAAAATLEALARGAGDYVTKPSGVNAREQAVEHVRNQLIPKIKVLAGSHGRARPSIAVQIDPAAKPRVPLAAPRPGAAARIELLAVGASTGGPNALADLFKMIPAKFPVPVVIVQHMPPLFTQLLAERLTGSCALRFVEAKEGEVLTPGTVWIAPGDNHMRLVRRGTNVVVTLDKEPPENSCRPAVDVLFRSVAELYGNRSLAVILTGMGQDGLRGCEQIRAQGGSILAQDEATSVVWGMPGFVARAGLADAVLPLEDMAADILRRVTRGTMGLEEKARRVNAG